MENKVKKPPCDIPAPFHLVKDMSPAATAFETITAFETATVLKQQRHLKRQLHLKRQRLQSV